MVYSCCKQSQQFDSYSKGLVLRSTGLAHTALEFLQCKLFLGDVNEENSKSLGNVGSHFDAKSEDLTSHTQR